MAAKSESMRRGTVLVVDDEKAIRDSLRMVMEYEGYRVLEAATGEPVWRAATGWS